MMKTDSETGLLADSGKDHPDGSGDANVPQEYEFMTGLLSQIPTKAMKGIFNQCDLQLTSLAVSERYICIGSNVGVIFVHDRRKHSLDRLHCKSNEETITCIHMHHGIDHHLAAGTTVGGLYMFNLPSDSDTTIEPKKFAVHDVHKMALTCVHWSSNGMKLFSGDKKGVVVCTEVDFQVGLCKSSLLLTEVFSEIVQLSYHQRVLLVSSKQRTVICRTDRQNQVIQVGQKARKTPGNFGACFIPSMCKVSDTRLYACRPGQRIWKSNIDGVVEATYIFKDLLARPQPEMSLLIDESFAEPPMVDQQFGTLLLYKHNWILTWNGKVLFLLDPVNNSVVGKQAKIGHILDVAVHSDEIFVLRRDSGRSVIRIALSSESMTYEASNSAVSMDAPTSNEYRKISHSPASLKERRSQSPIRFLPPNIFGVIRPKDSRKLVCAEEASKPKKVLSGNVKSQDFVESDLSGGHGSGGKSVENTLDPLLDAANEVCPEMHQNAAGKTPQDIFLPPVVAVAPEEITNIEVYTSLTDKDSVMDGGSENGSIENRTPSFLHTLVDRIKVTDNESDEIVFRSKTGKKKKTGKRKDNTISSPKVQRSQQSSESAEDSSSIHSDVLSICEAGDELESSEAVVITTEVCAVEVVTDDVLSETALTVHVDPDSIQRKVVCSSEQVQEAKQTALTDTFSCVAGSVSQRSVTLKFGGRDSPNVLGCPAKHENKRENILIKDGNDEDLDRKTDVLAVNREKAGQSCLASDPAQKVTSGLLHKTGLVLTTDPGSQENKIGEIMSIKDLVDVDNKEEQQQLLCENNIEQVAAAEQKDCDQSPSSLNNNESSALNENEAADSESKNGKGEDLEANKCKNYHYGDKKMTLYLSVDSSSEDFYQMYHSATCSSHLSSPERMPSFLVTGNMEKQPESEKLDFQNEIRETQVLLPKLVNRWMEVSVPVNIQSLAVSNKHIWYADRNEKIFYSSLELATPQWHMSSGSGNQIAVSNSGSIVWRLYKSTVYFATRIIANRPDGLKWMEAVRDVAYISVDDDCAWYIKSNGQVAFQRDLSKERPAYRSEKVFCEYCLSQIVCQGKVVWALTNHCQLICRVGVSDNFPEGKDWCLLEGNNLPLFTSIALGNNQLGWGVDIFGRIWFCCDITRSSPFGDKTWYEVPMSEYFMQDMTVLDMMKSMAEKLDPQKLALLMSSQQGGLIAANHLGTLFVPAYRNNIHVCKSIIQGHQWELAPPIGMAASSSWRLVNAGGVHQDNGFIWAQQQNGELMAFSPQCQLCKVIIQPTISSCFTCLSACKYSVWGLSTRGHVFVRSGVRPRCPEGMDWIQMDLSQLRNSRLVHLSCGTENVWAVDDSGAVYQQIGVVPPMDDTLKPVWLPVDTEQTGIVFTQVVTGPQDWIVWGIDNHRQVYVRLGVSVCMPIGTKWAHIPGTLALQLTISNTMVWALNPDGKVLCRLGISKSNICGDYWKKIPGNFIILSASPDDELWAISQEMQLHKRNIRYIFQKGPQASVYQPRSSLEEDDWEIV